MLSAFEAVVDADEGAVTGEFFDDVVEVTLGDDTEVAGDLEAVVADGCGTVFVVLLVVFVVDFEFEVLADIDMPGARF